MESPLVHKGNWGVIDMDNQSDLLLEKRLPSNASTPGDTHLVETDTKN